MKRQLHQIFTVVSLGLIVLIAAGPALAQAPGWSSNNGAQPNTQPAAQPGAQPYAQPGVSAGAAGPNQPVNPQLPTLERRAVSAAAQPQTPPPPPFTLSPQQQMELDRVLAVWEQKSASVKTFDCSFMRWEYNKAFSQPSAPGQPPKPQSKVQGAIKFAAPDKGSFQTIYRFDNVDKQIPIPDDESEHWMCDGKSVFQYHIEGKDKTADKVLIEYKLPPEMQGKAIANSPLPFLFGAEAKKLKERYFMRLVEASNQAEIWLESYPRFQPDAANFDRVTLILDKTSMSPKAMRLVAPGGNNYYSYQFFDIIQNDPLRFLTGDPFKATLPRGWRYEVREPEAQSPPQPRAQGQAQRPTNGPATR